MDLNKWLNDINKEIYLLEQEKEKDILRIAELRARYCELQSNQISNDYAELSHELKDNMKFVEREIRFFQNTICLFWLFMALTGSAILFVILGGILK